MPARTSFYGRLTLYRIMRPFAFQDFSGGWNIRDAPTNLADNESPDLLNVTLTERGSITKRLGYARLGSGAGLSAPPKNIFYWKSKDVFIVQDGAVVKKTTDFTVYTTVHTYTTAATASFADFMGTLVAVHPVDGTASYDNTTWTPTAAPANFINPKGNCIAVWQNKVWIAGDPANPERVYASTLPATGSPVPPQFAVADYNDMVEKNRSPITALGIGQGMDILGRPSLLVFKQNWIGAINNADASSELFGSYTTLHDEAGACSPQCVTTTLAGVVCSINTRGIWASDGTGVPQLVSGKIDPLFEPTQLNFAACGGWCAERDGNNVIFCISRQGSNVNNLTLQYNPAIGWIVPHDHAFSCLTLYSKDQHEVYGGSTTQGKIFHVGKGWADDGADITARFQTKWFEPMGGYSIRMRRMRVRGRGTFQVCIKHDYNNTVLGCQEFNSALASPDWGTAVWDQFEWGRQPFVAFRDLFSWGVARAFSVVVTETSQLSAYIPTLLDGTTTEETGSFALNGVVLDYVRLGYS